MDLQKVGPAADRCVFSSLRAGSLYRLQVVSWSRGMSSDSSVLSRTGQSTRLSSCYQCFNGFWSWSDLIHQSYSSSASTSSSFIFVPLMFPPPPPHHHVFCLFSSTVPSSVSSLQVNSSGRTDRLTVSWQHGEGSWSSYQVTDGQTMFIFF